MGLYNFKERFAPRILDGSKCHTIRPLRAFADKPGNTLHLYTGLRTKSARLLMRVPCVRIESITMRQVKRRQWEVPHLEEDVIVAIDGVVLDRGECEAFARRDGFENFDDMMKFWSGRLPFKGQIIHWKAA
jgi:hypothetical protein